MYLKMIKLAGFKSFVDPTTLHLQSNLTGVVGPNGCGKSNIIDAVRWVIGESSAKQLRGESLTDVIFNGSTGRKPAGKASIELIFDNSDGTLGGEYATYNEISVRRELGRDAQSHFYLNGSRCRRRDIMDVFLGTGLGPRSYAIIEQGMISQLIEAKPEDIRIYLEEAAGISKYKERRRETENRINHTRENLSRLNDLREELDKQLSHLKRQANAAERYKVLKQEQRLLKAQLQALNWRSLHQQLKDYYQSLQARETELEGKIAELRHIDAQLETLRTEQSEHNDTFNEVQGRYYQLGAEIAKQEQTLQHIHERQRLLEKDLAQIDANWQEAEQHLSDDQAQIEELTEALLELEPSVSEATEALEALTGELHEAEHVLAEWQTHWDHFNTGAAKANQAVEVEQTRSHHIHQRLQGLQQRIQRLEEQRQHLDLGDLPQQIETLNAESTRLKTEIENFQTKINQINQQIGQQRIDNQHIIAQREQLRDELQKLLAQKTSLDALQEVALGKKDQAVGKWLQQYGLAEKPRLLEKLRVEPGWENAVETVLGPYLQAVCLEDIATVSENLDHFTEGNLTVMSEQAYQAAVSKPNTLAAKVQSELSISNLLAHIHIAANVNEALNLSKNLAAHESVITAQGIWFGPNWVRISKVVDETSGILQRKKALQDLSKLIDEQRSKVTAQEELVSEGQIKINELEEQRDHLQQEFRKNSTHYSEVHSALKAKQAHLEQLRQRESAAQHELNELQQQLSTTQEQYEAVQLAIENAASQKQAYEQKRAHLLSERDKHKERVHHLRQQVHADKRKVDEDQVKMNSSRNQLHFLQQNITRVEKQLEQLRDRRDELAETLGEVTLPLEDLQAQLEEVLGKRLVIQNELNIARDKRNQVEHQLRGQEQARQQIEHSINQQRQQLEQLRVDQRALEVKRDTYLENIAEAGYELQQLLTEMPAEADIHNWQQQIEQLETRIQRLGPINLAAIDEHATLSERKTYLDSQNDDLLAALTTLEEAIQKIDGESRTRLKETFDKTNDYFKSLFPKVFGGGQASLELTDDDVLSTGVIIKAQPPGKRNTTIHLLSGGEKALTAVSLIFSFFQLNPAPFCMLDEVDAPLDDANVMRFCNLVKEMSEKVQFIFITHNKVTMEMSKQLAGVTMHEPGVSRLVSVDIDEAVAMATT